MERISATIGQNERKHIVLPERSERDFSTCVWASDQADICFPDKRSYGSAKISGLITGYTIRGESSLWIDQRGAVVVRICTSPGESVLCVLSKAEYAKLRLMAKSGLQIVADARATGRLYIPAHGNDAGVSLVVQRARASSFVFTTVPGIATGLSTSSPSIGVYIPGRGVSNIEVTVSAPPTKQKTYVTDTQFVLGVDACIAGSLSIPVVAEPTEIFVSAEAVRSVVHNNVMGTVVTGIQTDAARGHIETFSHALSVLQIESSASSPISRVFARGRQESITVTAAAVTKHRTVGKPEPNVIGISTSTGGTAMWKWATVGDYDTIAMAEMDTSSLGKLEKVVIG